ncbi:hypothetical protein B0H66DRAFT_569238 [Apodospora peruviana]|uniref:Uncharacterized protein n=1 Tax=Apodospora peruviana TaxID=516989 RepID=A0AAE0HVY4_9PEZI|nr:hypothetical protein B0H66DRAFT_569238 [Apodospora peruviana]
MAAPLEKQQNVAVAANFIETRAPQFHGAFGVPSTLNVLTMQYEPPEVRDLRETLQCQHEKAARYVDFTNDLTKCTWEDVHRELKRAQAAMAESERRGKNPIRRAWRAVGTISEIIAPGLSAIPDDLCVLHGGLALIFSLARHSEMNRVKILAAFENVPNIIEIAWSKAKTFPLDRDKPKSVKLHQNVEKLQETLLKTLPMLINKLVPGTFLNAWRSPFNGWKIDRLLDEVKVCAEGVRVCAEGLMEDLIVDSYAASMDIRLQLTEVLQHTRMIQMSLNAATQGKTHLLHFLVDQLNQNANGVYPGRDQTDLVSERGTALPGYTPEDLLRIMDVNHLRVANDAVIVLRRHTSLPPADVDRAATGMIMAPQMKELLSMSTPGPCTVAVEGHFDRTQFGQVSPLSYVSAMLSQALRQQSEQYATAAAASQAPTSPTSPQLGSQHHRKGSFGAASVNGGTGPSRSAAIVLEYFCALHTSADDDLRGPQGLLRCLTTQLILALVANEWIGHADAVHLPHLRDGEEELLRDQNLDAVCRLFVALVHLVPGGVPVYCLVDGWSAYEREERMWQTDYESVLGAFRDAADAGNPDGGANFRLLLTSPTSCRWLGDFVMPGQKVSLRNQREARNWVSPGRGGVKGLAKGLARASTMPDAAFGAHHGFDDGVHGEYGYGGGVGGGPGGGEFDGPYPKAQYGQQQHQPQAWVGEGYDRRSST